MVKKNVLSIIRARMNSTRLPGKMLLPIIDNKSSLQLMLERVSRVPLIDNIVVATTDNESDVKIEELCKNLGYSCFRGSEENVLDRCYKAVLEYLPFDALVILTGDCILLDPGIVNGAIDFFIHSDYNYVSNNNIPTTYPDGLDVEVCSFDVLEKMWNNATTKAEKEHMTFYIQKNKSQFKTFNLEHIEDFSDKGWCLDTPEDFEFIKKVYEELYHDDPFFDADDILALLKRKPEIEMINSKLKRNEWRDKSMKDDNVKEL